MRLRWLALATIFMSIPLFATYQLKHVTFSPGYVFVVLYTWGLIAVVVLPLLLLGEFGVIVLFLRRHADRVTIRTHAFAVAIALLAEAVFLYVRSYA